MKRLVALVAHAADATDQFTSAKRPPRLRAVRNALVCLLWFAACPAFAEDPPPPPAPSDSSTVGQEVTNPVTDTVTKVSNIVADPAGSPTSGDTAFVQTEDGYTFLVKSVGEIVYNDDPDPVPFEITAIDGNDATLTTAEASEPIDFPVGQTTTDFEAAFNSSGSTDPTTPAVDSTAPDGVKQVVYGANGGNGRAGALFVPPASGGNGKPGPSQTQTLGSDVNATSKHGWEIGSVGGNGGKGGDSVLSFWSGKPGGDGGDGGTVTATQAQTSTIVTSGNDNIGIFAYSRSGVAGNGGDGILAPGGGAGGKSADGGSVTVNQYGTVSTSGANAHGIYALSVGNNGGSGGDQWGLVGVSGGGGAAGNGGAVNVNTFDGAEIQTTGDFSNGILAQSVGGTGGSGGFSGNLLVSLVNSDTDPGGNAGTVTVSNGGSITTTGAISRGIMAQSIGGGGGAGGTAGGLVSLALGGVTSGGGSGSEVSVTNEGTGSIATKGILSDGIMAQSIGGSGGRGANAFGLVAVGGDGSAAGSGAAVTVRNDGRIVTEGAGARGIVAQSIGGGGGDGGSSGGMVSVGGDGAGGGAGGKVTVVNDGVVFTGNGTEEADDAIGILAQSIGGGGGNGGSSGSVGAFVGVAVGGSGGGGGDGGTAEVVLSDTDASQPSTIRTNGARSTGVFIQSVGGGGGNGGGAVSVAVGAFGAASVAVGGEGGNGGAGGTVTLTGSGDVSVQTDGTDSTGILMQSVGGGGGNGGYAVAAAAAAGPVSGSLSVGVGGSGGSGGNGGEVTVGTISAGNLVAPGFSGNVLTTDARSSGLVFQSIGGGGGNGGLSVAASAGGSLFFSGNVSVAVGGSGGNGGTGGLVRVSTASDIVTRGESSTALLAQSVGGGGGNGGGSIAAGVSGSGGGAGSIGVSVGGSGSGGGTGGDVTLVAGGESIRTTGQFSAGVVAQSIGGGGGNGGYSVAAGAAGAGVGAAAVNVGVGGAAANGGNGGTVNARVDADVTTEGTDSGAVLIQSVGGGGGNGGFSVAAGAAGGGVGAGAVSVGLGGSAGAGGTGGTVTGTVNGVVSTEEDRSAGVVVQSIGGGGGNGGFSVSGTISGGGTGAGSVSVGLGGSGGSGGNGGTTTATVTDDVTTQGADSTAILAQSVGGGGGNGGFNISGAISGGGVGSGAVAVGLGGKGGAGATAGTVTLTSDGNVWTQGDRSAGVVAQSIGGGGGNGGFNVSGSVAGAGTGSGTVSVGLGGDGAGGGAAGAVNATSNGTILTYGFASSGFVAQSIGGGGGNGAFNVSAGVAGAGVGAGSIGVGLGGSGAGGGDGSTVTARTTANIETRGESSTGILAQSIGGGGGNGGFNVTPTISGAGTGAGSISVGLGGSGAGGGNGGTVGLTVENSVLTRGVNSSAVVAQSLGGGGGNGGFNVSAGGAGAGTGSGTINVGLGGSGGTGGDGGTVTSSVTGNLTTLSERSSGLVVQSLGGGGGNGGFNVSAGAAGAGTGSGAASVGIGGSGGDGGDGGSATSVLTGNVITAGKDSAGVVVQSLGGGGGNGGLNVSATITGAGTGSGGIAVGIGGSGGGGGDSGAVDSTITGNVSTLDENAGGVLVQSAGGGGGNGGLNVSGAVNLSGTGGGAAAVGVGGSGGGGGDGGTATSRMTGNIATAKKNSAGLTVQSLGGGGGNGGLNVSAAVSLSGQAGGAAGIGVGGTGGDGGDAAAVDSGLIGDVTTAGENSSAVLVQSLGGGGGNGGLNVGAAVNLSSQAGGAVGVGVGGMGGDGGDGAAATGSVTGDVTTTGDNSYGVLVQSAGGGGGNGGLNVSGAVSLTGKGSGAAAIGVGGFGGDGGIAGDVTGRFVGTAMTDGDRSAGVVAQSLGGGGGNGGINVSAAVSMSGQASGALGIGVGGFGGGGGVSGSVDHTVAGYTQTEGDDSYGILSQSLGGGGGNGGLNVSGAVSLSRSTSGAIGVGVGGFGGDGADAGTLTRSDVTGGVLTFGDRSVGIATQSLGGGGGNGGTNISGALNLTQQSGGAAGLGVGGFGGGGGNGGAVSSTVRTTEENDSIVTRGDDSIGILAQSVGGGGGAGGVNVSGAVSLTGKSGAAVALGVGGFGGDGGDADTVSLDVEGTVSTLGDRAHAIMAQSLGGGGGTGGTNVSGTLSLTKPSGSDTIFSVSVGVGGFGGGGGDADAVDLSYSGALTALPRTVDGGGATTVNETQGANGLVAQSIGGGGGDGGLNVSGGVAISSKPGAGQSDGSKSYGVVVGVGGFGGTGGNAGTVDVDVADGSTIRAHGTGRSGIMAQSVGGGGGNGGLNVSGGIVSDTSLIVGVGGMGGNAGRADNVTVTARADIDVTTDPDDFGEPSDDSFESKLRDVLGDTVVDAAEDMVDSYGLKRLFVDIGLFKSDEEAPETEGSAGLLAQSIGGGGGNGGLNVSGGIALSKDGKIPSVTFGIGGFGGAGNVSGDVLADHAGTIDVEGNWKHGIFAQSIAGGGGNGGLNVSGQLNWGSSEGSDGATDLSIVAGLGGHGGEGADAGDVEVISTGNITTEGYHARGLFAQSIGGGGGTGGINVTAVGTKDSTPVGIGVGGFGSGGGHAGDVTVTRGTETELAGLIQTDGVGSHGIEASSIGGGGGDAGVNAVLGVSKTTGSKSNGGTEGDRSTPTNTGVDDSVITNFNAVLDELEGKTNADPGGGKQVNSAVIAIGGSAGSAGNGGNVDVTHFGDVTTEEEGSYGVFAQSIGGGGGNGAFNLGAVYEAGNAEENRGFGLAVGGGTGNGGTGGNVSIDNTGLVETQGDNSHGIFAQSVGGGGGNAGYNMLSQSGDGGNVGITIGRTGGTGGSAGDVFASSNGVVMTHGSASHGLFAQSIGNGGGNSSSTKVSLATAKKGDDKGNSFSLSVGLEGGEGGAAGNVTAEAEGLLATEGDDSHGIFAQSVGGGGGNGGSASSSASAATSYSLSIGGTGGTGGTSGDVGVTSSAEIATGGDRATGILAQSIGGAGGTGGAVKAGTTPFSILKNLKEGKEIGTTASINIGGTGGEGMTSGDVAVDSDGIVTTVGDYAHGIHAQSVGGGGGKGGLVENNIVNIRSTIASTATLSIGGDGGTGAVSGDVQVANSSDIGTQGLKSAGIFAQSVGGGGGDAQYVRNIIAGADANNSTRNALLIGGSGGTGGAAGDVDVTNATGARIITEGDESHGVFAQSIGGGGGNGSDVLSVSVSRPGSESKVKQGLNLGIGGSGGTGGTGGAVDVVNDGLIITRGDKAHGILAQSVGGGGGNGGYSITGTVTLQKGVKSDPTMALNIGGAGGSGNAADNVSVTNSGEIEVLGAESYGILAQSVGGGGGNGGLAISMSVNDLADAAKAKSYKKIAIGGAGGDGADGGDVTVKHSGTIAVRGRDAYGIFAQSVGGGGGNAGLSVSTPAVMAADYVISTLLGAREGTNGKAGKVTVTSTGDIVVTGAGSQAVFSQAVNGGGGNVNTFLDFTKEADGDGGSNVDISGEVALGGEDVDGTDGSDVDQKHTGDLVTTKDRSNAMLLQSIGGGGGTSQTRIRADGKTDVSLKGTLGAVNTDDASGGNVTASRKGTVATLGDLSGGGLTQSIGGGGGRMVVDGGGKAGSGDKVGRAVLGADPSFRNDGGDIDLTLDGAVQTLGDNASGQVVQSIGAGGGETYLTGLDKARVTMGATDDSTGDGGAVALSSKGDVETSGDQSHGFVLQSIGGGGGLVGTDLEANAVAVKLSTANGGDGGAIDFENRGSVVTTGDDAVGVLAQSIGGGGGSADDIFRGSAGGAGSGGAVSLDLTGNVMALGEGGIAVMAQSAGRDGAGPIDVALDGVIVGGSGGRYRPDGRTRPGAAGSTSGTAAIVIDGGTQNRVLLSEDSFLMSLNDRILSGGSGSDEVVLGGKAVGNVDLGDGTNGLTIRKGGAFTALKRVDLGKKGLLKVNGALQLGGTPYLKKGSLNGDTKARSIKITENVSQTTDVTGSLRFGRSATYTPDVSFRADGAAGGDSDLIRVTGDGTLSGTLTPVLNLLERSAPPLTLIHTDGLAADKGTEVVGTPVLSYSIGVTNSPGNSGTISLIAEPDFVFADMNRNQTATAEHINRVLGGQGSVDMGPMLALIANMQSVDEVIDAIDRLMSEDYASTISDALYSGRRFANTISQCDYFNREARPGDDRTCYWAMAIDSDVTRDGSSQYRKFESEASTFSLGARVPMDNDLYLGLAGAFENFSMTNGDRFSADGDRTALGLSLWRFEGPWEVYGMLSGSTARYDSTRVIGISGTLPNGDVVGAGTARAKQKVNQANIRIGTGYRYEPTGSSVFIRPGLDLDATYLHSASTNERGTDFGLKLDDTSQWVLSATPSLEVAGDVFLGGNDYLRGFLRGDVTFANSDTVYVDATFAGASSSDGTFRNHSAISDVTRSLKAGATIYSNENSAYLSIGYQSDWGDDFQGSAATLDFGMRF